MSAEYSLRAIEYSGSQPSVIIEIRGPNNKALAFLYPTGRIPNLKHTESERVDSLLFALAQLEYLELSSSYRNSEVPEIKQLFLNLRKRLYACEGHIQIPNFIADSFLKNEGSFLELGPKFSVPQL